MSTKIMPMEQVDRTYRNPFQIMQLRKDIEELAAQLRNKRELLAKLERKEFKQIRCSRCRTNVITNGLNGAHCGCYQVTQLRSLPEHWHYV